MQFLWLLLSSPHILFMSHFHLLHDPAISPSFPGLHITLSLLCCGKLLGVVRPWSCQIINTKVSICFHPLWTISYLFLLQVIFSLCFPGELLKWWVFCRFKCSEDNEEWRQRTLLPFLWPSALVDSLFHSMCLSNEWISLLSFHTRENNFSQLEFYSFESKMRHHCFLVLSKALNVLPLPTWPCVHFVSLLLIFPNVKLILLPYKYFFRKLQLDNKLFEPNVWFIS